MKPAQGLSVIGQEQAIMQSGITQQMAISGLMHFM
jgi:hypothetical protein